MSLFKPMHFLVQGSTDFRDWKYCVSLEIVKVLLPGSSWFFWGSKFLLLVSILLPIFGQLGWVNNRTQDG